MRGKCESEDDAVVRVLPGRGVRAMKSEVGGCTDNGSTRASFLWCAALALAPSLPRKGTAFAMLNISQKSKSPGNWLGSLSIR